MTDGTKYLRTTPTSRSRAGDQASSRPCDMDLAVIDISALQIWLAVLIAWLDRQELRRLATPSKTIACSSCRLLRGRRKRADRECISSHDRLGSLLTTPRRTAQLLHARRDRRFGRRMGHNAFRGSPRGPNSRRHGPPQSSCDRLWLTSDVRKNIFRNLQQTYTPGKQVGPLNDRATLQFDGAARSFGQRDAAEARRRISKRL